MIQNIISYLKQINKILLVVIAVGFILLIVALILGLKRHTYNGLILYMVIIFIINSILSFYSYPKDKILPYLFSLAAIFVEIFTIIIIIYF